MNQIKVVVVCNIRRKVEHCLLEIVNFLKGRIEYQVIQHYPLSHQDQQTIASADLVVVLGGDGTTLMVIQSITCFKKTKLIPVNFGTLGYMNSVGEHEIIGLIKSYLDFFQSGISTTSSSQIGDQNLKSGFKLDGRCMIKVNYQGKFYCCLNELVLVHSDPSKPISIRIKVNREELADFKGNGVILATPTGSTAYNMSAGGPILAPNVDAMILNPLAAHLLNFKPIVLSEKESIEISTLDQGTIILDGMKIAKMDEPVFCEIASEKLQFVKPSHEDHIKVLKKKLRFAT